MPLTGPDAVRLWQIDQTIGALGHERQDVLARLRASGSAGEPIPTGQPYATAPGLRVAAAAVSSPAGGGPRWSGQQVLLSIGALLVLVAGTVFVAVTWTAIGVLGQVSVMAVVTVLAGWASLRLARHGLRATSVALAVLTIGLAVVDASAAYALDLAGLQQVDDITYLAFAAAVLAVTFALVSWRNLTIVPYPWGSVIAAAVVPVAALVATEASAAVSAGVSLLAAAAFAALRHGPPTEWRRFRMPLMLAAGGYLAVSWWVSLPTVFHDRLWGQGGWCAAVALLAAAGCATVARRDLSLSVVGRHPFLVLSAVLSVAIVLVGVAGHERPVGPVVLALLAAAASASIWFPRRPFAANPLGCLGAVAQLAALGAVLDLAVYADLDRPVAHPFPLSLALGAVALGAGVIAVRQPGLRFAAAIYATGAGIGAVAVAVSPYGDRWIAAVLISGAVVGAGLAGWRRARSEEWGLAVVSMAAALGSVWFAAGTGARPLAVVLAISGLAALVYGMLPQRGYVAILGVLGCSASTWTLFLDAGVRAVEAYSLPLAAFIGLVGLVRLRRDPGAPSWLTVGPALSAALLPSAVRSIGDEGLTRPLLVLLAGAIVLVAGVLLRWQSPVVLGAVTLGLVVISQLTIYAVGLPRWLSFGSVGLVLLILGARYERRRRNARQAAHWVAALR